MNRKEFLKPTLGKLILFFILFSLFSFVIIAPQVITSMIPPGTAKVYGFPSVFITIGGPELGTHISWIEFLINTVFWYLVSCFNVFGYNILRNKK